MGTKSGVVELKRGQFISGRLRLSEHLEQSERCIRTSLSRLVDMGIISVKTTNKYSIYTIENYSKYQDMEIETTNKRPTNDQQTTTKQEHKNNNNKNISSSDDDSFSYFWRKYPKKVGKDAALKVWEKTKPDISKVLETLEWQIKSQQWKEGYIPNPTTYLNQGRWKDEPAGNARGFSL